MNIERYLAEFPKILLKKINIEDTLYFNNVLEKYKVSETNFPPWNYVLKAVTVEQLEDVFEVVDALSVHSSESYVLQKAGLISLFSVQSEIDEEKYNQTYFNFFDMIANGRPDIFSLKNQGDEYLFLENTSVWGGIRILKYGDKIRLLMLSAYN